MKIKKNVIEYAKTQKEVDSIIEKYRENKSINLIIVKCGNILLEKCNDINEIDEDN